MDSKKKNIIDSATELFYKHGFDKTSVSQIVLHAGVSKGLVYHYFKNKDDLLREIYSSTTKRIFEINDSAQKNANPKKQLLHLIEQIFQQLESDKLFFRFNLSLMFQPSTRELLRDLIKERSSYLYKSVLTLFSELGSEDPELSSYIFIAEIDGIALDYLSVFEHYPISKLKNHLINKYWNTHDI